MKIRVVTSCDAALWQAHGAEFVAGFKAHWPVAVDLHVYRRGMPVDAEPRVVYWDALQKIPDLIGWNIKNHSADYAYGEIAPGHYSRLHDAGRLANKVFALFDALQKAKRDGVDRLIWCDIDVRWFADVPLEWLESTCPDNRHAAYLHRHYAVPDTGFVVFNVKTEFGAGVIELLHDAWETNGIFKLPHYTDAYLMLMVMRALSQREGAKFRSIAGGAEYCWAVWQNSPLGKWSDHLFGVERKAAGYSPLSDFVEPPTHSYWSAAPAKLDGCPTDPIIRHAVEGGLNLEREKPDGQPPIPVA